MTETELLQLIEYPNGKREAYFVGTKIRVIHIIDDLAKGMSFEEILKEHKLLSQKHIQAIFVFMKKIIRDEETFSLSYSTGIPPFLLRLFDYRKDEEQG